MTFVLKDSPECVKSELELFHLPSTQTAILGGQWVEFFPISNVYDSGVVEFHVSGSGEDYIDLSQTQLYVKVKILKSDDKVLDKESKIGPVNLFLHSMFSQVDVSLNDRAVSSSNNTYPYVSYIETLLNHGEDSKNSQLTTELFYKDTGTHDISDGNLGYAKRAKLFKGSATVDMIGSIHSDIFNQDRLLLNLVDLKIKLIRSKPEFCLMGVGVHKVVLEHASLFVRKTKVSSGVLIGHSRALERTPAKYPINRVSCKVYSIPSGGMSITQDNVFVGQMPNRVIVGFVDNDAFHGTYQKSPFNFKHYGLNFLGLYIDGQSVPYTPITTNFAQNNYIRGYQSLFLGTEKFGEDHGINISREDYPKGYCLFGFNLTADIHKGAHFNLIKHSNLRIEAKFSEPLSQTVSAVIYAEFDNVININKERNIIYDFSS